MLQITDLSFQYARDTFVLHNLSMSVPKGAIYGFVGANGAGKSTTIRLLLRLLHANKGSITIDGNQLSKANFEKIGFLVDRPVFYEHLTVLQNLKLLQRYYRNVNDMRITGVMERLDLSAIKDRLYKSCSTGMKQRMGIAKAIIHQPDLIVLDEPLNGLDPEWVIYVRDLLVEINKQFHTTIFFTNHILSEVEKIATHIGILKSGRLAMEMPIGEVSKITGENALLVTCQSIGKLPSDLFGIPFIRIDDNKLLFTISENCSINHILTKVIEKRLIIEDVAVKGNDLESIFLHILK